MHTSVIGLHLLIVQHRHSKTISLLTTYTQTEVARKRNIKKVSRNGRHHPQSRSHRTAQLKEERVSSQTSRTEPTAGGQPVTWQSYPLALIQGLRRKVLLRYARPKVNLICSRSFPCSRLLVESILNKHYVCSRQRLKTPRKWCTDPF